MPTRTSPVPTKTAKLTTTLPKTMIKAMTIRNELQQRHGQTVGIMKFNSNQTVAYPEVDPISNVGGAADRIGLQVPEGAIFTVARMTEPKTKLRMTAAAHGRTGALSQSHAQTHPHTCKTIADQAALWANDRASAASVRAAAQPGGKASRAN